MIKILRYLKSKEWFQLMNLVMSGITLAIYWSGAYLINNAEGMDKLKVWIN
jgi:ATP-binding cassette subfamily B protein